MQSSASAVLAALWDRIAVRGCKAAKLTLRADSASRAHRLIATALEVRSNGRFDGDGITSLVDLGPGAALNSSKSGKGGIRTLEGVSHPLPA